MSKQKSYTTLKERGLIAQEGGGTLDEILSQPRKVYLGVDPSADSLHVGNLVPILVLKHLYDLGHEPYLLVGGATGMIGDPRESGERQLLDTEVLTKNTRAIKKQLSTILKKDSLKVFNNADWLAKLSLLDFLRDTGKHFSVNQLIKRDIIKRRLETEEDSISYTEFSYSLLQGYDYLHLFKKHSIDLQVGGSDQWANIISGVDLIRRKTGASTYALTTPIVTDKVTGKKFGKSEGNAIWLDPKKTSPFIFYQFWINVSDENVEEYLKIFTFLNLKDISKLMAKHLRSPQNRLAQKTLAKEITTFIHGLETTSSVEKVSEILFGSGSLPTLTDGEKKMLVSEVPSQRLKSITLKKGISLVEILVSLNLATSKSDARQLISSGAIRINGTPITTIDTILTEQYLKDNLIFIKRGKKVALLFI